ncbi:hypothetical protein OnM2_099055 [Erysiphe neolycopersici]|uniref:Uncharacterized protein n=1 Tax=Erysiphe neolycopersici TaxID=212602 RepID=A0A420H9W2_9PEZI|nr:hypothetical protein OnM2_099055 [Erysiphe neolycopersici]
MNQITMWWPRVIPPEMINIIIFMVKNSQTPLEGTTLGVQKQGLHSRKPRSRLDLTMKSHRQNTARTRLSMQLNTSLEVI